MAKKNPSGGEFDQDFDLGDYFEPTDADRRKFARREILESRLRSKRRDPMWFFEKYKHKTPEWP